MSILAKIKADAAAGARALLARYAAIQSPTLRLAVLACIALAALVLVLHFLPEIILIALILAVGTVFWNIMRGDFTKDGE